MKLKAITLLVVMLALTNTTHAKAYHNGRLLVDAQISTIKGFLYNISHADTEKGAEKFRIACAKALVWLNKVHVSKAKTELMKTKGDDAELISETIKIIIEVIQGKHPKLPAGIAIPHWTRLGERVIVEYSEKMVYDPATKSKQKQIKWKFALKPGISVRPKQKNKKTRHLIYRW